MLMIKIQPNENLRITDIINAILMVQSVFL